jgi:hypothetical protein
MAKPFGIEAVRRMPKRVRLVWHRVKRRNLTTKYGSRIVLGERCKHGSGMGSRLNDKWSSAILHLGEEDQSQTRSTRTAKCLLLL